MNNLREIVWQAEIRLSRTTTTNAVDIIILARIIGVHQHHKILERGWMLSVHHPVSVCVCVTMYYERQFKCEISYSCVVLNFLY